MTQGRTDQTGRKTWRRELFGLAVVLAAGGGMLAWVGRGIGRAVENASARQAAEAEIRPDARTMVDVAVVRAQTVNDVVRLPGLVFANASVKVPVEVDGVVVRRAVENGARVAKGDVLVVLDDRDARIAKERTAAALALEQTQLARERELHANHVSTTAAFDKAVAAHAAAKADDDEAALALTRAVVRSPIDGYVARIDPEPGERLEAGGIVAVVVDLDRVKVRVGISERDLAEVRDVEEAPVHAGGPPPNGIRATGRRTYLALEPREGSQVYVLELRVDNPDLALRPGMFVEADIPRGTRENSTWAPAFAVLPDAGGHAVFRVEAGADGAEVVRRVPVRIGVFDGERVEVRLSPPGEAGLREGDRLVVTGQRTLEDGERVGVRRSVVDLAELAR